MIKTVAGESARGGEAQRMASKEKRDRWRNPWMMAAEFAMPGIVFVSWLLATSRAYLSGNPWMYFLEDDFFYYLKIAQNLAHGKGSTFNGLVETNGYHPLWMLVLTGFSFVSSRGWMIFFFVAAVALVASMSTYFLAQRVLEQSPLNRLLRKSLAAYVGVYALHMFYTGMEILLAIPLMFFVMVLLLRRKSVEHGAGPAFLFGLTVSAMILSRLDLAIFTGLLSLFAVINADVRRAMGRKELAGLAFGLLPVIAYLAINHVHFGTWLPISGMAKQMKLTHVPSGRPWALVYARIKEHEMNLLPVHLAILSLPFIWRRLQTMQKVVFPAVLLFPFVYYFILSCVSDWQLWLWYLYPLRAAVCVSFVVLSLLPWVAKWVRSPLVAVPVLLVLGWEVATSRWWTDVQPGIYAAAEDIAGFSTTHPGVYAMGDRSGMVAYLMPYPVVQTEGLVMDRAFLGHIEREEPLLPTLSLYHARYYIGTAWKPYTGCFHVEEPFQAGATSRHMVSDLCSAPVASWDHEGKRTLVFDLEEEGRR